MNAIPAKLKAELAADPAYKVCARADDECSGRITREHALTYAGKQIQAKFAILALCVFHHLGAGLDKAWNIRYAMSRATEEDRRKYPRLSWKKYAL